MANGNGITATETTTAVPRPCPLPLPRPCPVLVPSLPRPCFVAPFPNLRLAPYILSASKNNRSKCLTSPREGIRSVDRIIDARVRHVRLCMPIVLSLTLTQVSFVSSHRLRTLPCLRRPPPPISKLEICFLVLDIISLFHAMKFPATLRSRGRGGQIEIMVLMDHGSLLTLASIILSTVGEDARWVYKKLTPVFDGGINDHL